MTARSTALLLPPPNDLERISIAIAALDQLLIAESYLRTFTYSRSWSDRARLATMDDGSGNVYQIVFTDEATVVRAFDHESDLSPWGTAGGEVAPGVLDGYPPHLMLLIDEPAFRTDGGPRTDLTFCAWRLAADAQWSAGPAVDDGGALWLLDVVIAASPEGYCRYAAEYLERTLDADAVQRFYDLQTVTRSTLLSLNSTVDFEVTAPALAELGLLVA